MQRFAAAIVFLSLSTGLWAQITASTEAASPSSLTSSAPSATPVTPAAPNAVAVKVPADTKPKLFDRSFKIWMGASFAATVADIESTSHGISSCGLVEANPLVGPKPTRAVMYGTGIPIAAGYNLVGALLKRHWPQRRIWMIFPAVETVGHAGAAAHNWALCH